MAKNSHQSLQWQLGMARVGTGFILLASGFQAMAAGPVLHRLPPNLTVEEFVAKYRSQNNIPGGEVNRRFAHGYLAGVVDASQGTVWWLDVAEGPTWCMPRDVDPTEVDEEIVNELARSVQDAGKRPPGSFPVSAGTALMTLYLTRFPATVDVCPPDFKPRLTGDEVLSHQLVPAGQTKWDQTSEATLRRTYAAGYQAGVVDTTQAYAWTWCAPRTLKPAEVNDRVWSEIKKRRGSMPGNGAAVLLELYTKRFPCNRQ